MSYIDYGEIPSHDGYDKIIELVKERFRKRIEVTEEFAFYTNNLEMKTYVDVFTKQLIMEFSKEVLYYKQEDLKYPVNWIEAFKERWFPKWLLKYYPVEYTLIEVREYYPRMAIPNGQDRYIRFMKGRGYGIY